MKDSQVQLVPVSNSDEHNSALYELLKKRHSGISHETLPTFTEHEEFVRNHPYRYWFIVVCNSKHIGSVYIQKDNTIGVNLLLEHIDKTEFVLSHLLSHYKPLAPVKSVRSKWFCINVPAEDENLVYEISKLKAIEIQRTYAFKDHN